MLGRGVAELPASGMQLALGAVAKPSGSCSRTNEIAKKMFWAILESYILAVLWVNRYEKSNGEDFGWNLGTFLISHPADSHPHLQAAGWYFKADFFNAKY